MKLLYIIFCELHKLFSHRAFRICVVILLAVQIGIVWYQTAMDDRSLSRTDIAAVFRLAMTDFDTYHAYSSAIDEFEELRNAIFDEQIQAGNHDFELPVWENQYITEGKQTDAALFSYVEHRVSYSEKYREQVWEIVNRAQKSLQVLAADDSRESAYLRSLQNKNLAIYKAKLYSPAFVPADVYGWDILLTDALMMPLIGIVVLFSAIILWTYDWTSGVAPIQRITANGGMFLGVGKLFAGGICCLLTVLLFFTAELILILFRVGLSAGTDPLCLFDAFILCPFSFSVIDGVLYSLGMKLIAAVLIHALVVLCCVAFHHTVFITVVSFTAVAGIYLLHTGHVFSATSLLRVVNPFFFSLPSALLDRYHTIRIFGQCIDALFALCVFIVSVLIFLWTVILIGYIFRRSNIMHRRSVRLRVPITVPKLPYIKPYTSIFNNEIYKKIGTYMGLFCIVLSLCMKLSFSNQLMESTNSYGDTVYKEYMMQYEGPWNIEKSIQIKAERKEIMDILAKYEGMKRAYAEQSISFLEYDEYLHRFAYATGRNQLFESIERHERYVLNQMQKGTETWFLYDSGWKTIFFSGFDYVLFGSILFIGAASFSVEYRNGLSNGAFVSILRTTKHGRRRSFCVKYGTTIMIAVVLSIVFSMIDLGFLYRNYTLPAWDAPVKSIIDLQALPWNPTIGQFLFLYLVLRMLTAMIWSIVSTALSAFLKNNYVTVVFGFLIMVLSAILLNTGTPYVQYGNCVVLGAVTPILLLPQGLWVSLFLWILICVISFLGTMRQWER